MPASTREKREPRVADGPPCPGNPGHGPLLSIAGDRGWRCNHQEHDGRPKTHPLGFQPVTKSWFAFHEVEW